MFNWDAANQEVEQLTAVEGEKARLLVVDDEDANLALIQGILSPHYEVVTAPDGPAALRLLDGDPTVSAILCDHRMPGMTGVDVFCELRRRQNMASRVILTGYAELQSIINAINQAGIFRYMTKPVAASELLETMHQAVADYEMRQEQVQLVGMVKGLLEDRAHLLAKLEAAGKDVSGRTGADHSGMVDARKVDVATMVVDIRGFTKFSGATPASHVMRALQTIFSRIHAIIYEMGGLVDKHLGDGLVAIFGLSGESGGKEAGVQAAKRIVETFPTLLASSDGADFRGLKLSVGLSAGEVIVGLLGTKHRSEFSIIGKPLIRADRLQEFSKLALTLPEGRDVLGEFQAAMCVCDASLIEGVEGFTVTRLGKQRVRDFKDVDRVGVFTL